MRYVGFTVPDEFFVGYGFDLDERYRNLPDLRLVARTQQSLGTPKLSARLGDDDTGRGPAALPARARRSSAAAARLRLLPFLGPAFIACVAYIDPGNFATNIAGGLEVRLHARVGRSSRRT